MARSAGLLRDLAVLVTTALLFSLLAGSPAGAEASCLSDAPCALTCSGNRSTIVVIGPSTTVRKSCAGGSADDCTTNATTPNKVCIYDGVVNKSGVMSCTVTAGAGKGECSNSMAATPAASSFSLALLALAGLLLGVRQARRRVPGSAAPVISLAKSP